MLEIGVILPEVSKILEHAKDNGLEYEVIAQMIVNTNRSKPTEVVQHMWDALADWDIVIKDADWELDKHIIDKEL